jgi:hypothetical protein
MELTGIAASVPSFSKVAAQRGYAGFVPRTLPIHKPVQEDERNQTDDDCALQYARSFFIEPF